MSKSFIISGCMFGDEGKGTISDYLANEYDLKENVRYNGGSHASHTVISNGISHKFSQLGSSFLKDNMRTFLSDNTIVNPFNLITEAKVLSDKTGERFENILERIFIDENAPIVTPYHRLINRVRELSNKNNRTGSVGTGVSEVKKVKEITGLELKVKDLLDGSSHSKLLELFKYTRNYILNNREKIDPKKYHSFLDTHELEKLIALSNKYYLIECYDNLINSHLLNIVGDIREFHDGSDILFEGSQGIMIDKDYGIKPNTTSLDTTNHYSVELAKLLDTEILKIGCISSLTSRHGMGILPTYDEYLQNRIYDENQSPSFYQGVPKYGWFDALLTRYSLKNSANDELFMSALDRLSYLDEIKVCNHYLYLGEIDEEFERTFDFVKDGNKIVINDIKQNSNYLRKYLARTIPIYKELKGFNKDISGVENYSDLPRECTDFVDLVEDLVGTKISLVGVGPSRKQKIKRR